MPWFKVDDHLPTHRKVLAIPRGTRRLAAVGAWTFGGAWCSANLTEGAIPRAVLDDLGIPTRQATELATVGLWIPTDDGYLMHDFAAYNPTKIQVERDRAAAAERQRRARERARERRDGAA